MVRFPSPSDPFPEPDRDPGSTVDGPDPDPDAPAARPPDASRTVSRPSVEEMDRMGDEIARLAAHLHAVTYQLLVRIGEFDRVDGWGQGFATCAHWLSWRTSIGLGAAREKVRVARALRTLPKISDAMRCGQLSYSKVRALTRVATPETEEKLLDFAHAGTTAHVERVVRAWRQVDRREERRRRLGSDALAEAVRHQERRLTLQPDADGSWIVRGRLDPEVGALLARALDAAGEALVRSGSGGAASGRLPPASQDPTPPQRLADAVGIVAEWAMAGAGEGGDREAEVELDGDGESGRTDVDEPAACCDLVPGKDAGSEPARGKDTRADVPRIGTSADRFRVTLHLRSGEEGYPTLDDEMGVSAETFRRLSCDGSRVVMRHADDGSVLDVGRQSRAIPTAIRRALDSRDRVCRFPGCEHRFLLQRHHIEHWIDGGKTCLRNLIRLCPRHHRGVHEDGFRVGWVRVRTERWEIRFSWPDGRPIPEVPPAPALPFADGEDDPLALIHRRHRALGLRIGGRSSERIDEWTATPSWFGERLELGWALEALRPLDARRTPGEAGG